MLVKTHPRLPETHVHVPTGSAGLWGLPSEYLGSWISVAWSIVYVTGVVSQNATKRERGDRVTPPPINVSTVRTFRISAGMFRLG